MTDNDEAMAILEPMEHIFDDWRTPGSELIRASKCGHQCWIAPSMIKLLAEQAAEGLTIHTVCTPCAPQHLPPPEVRNWRPVPGALEEGGWKDQAELDRWSAVFRRKMEGKADK